MKALITGASSGIGRDIAKILSKKGYDLALVSRDEEKLQNVKKELEKNNETKKELINHFNENYQKEVKNINSKRNKNSLKKQENLQLRYLREFSFIHKDVVYRVCDVWRSISV